MARRAGPAPSGGTAARSLAGAVAVDGFRPAYLVALGRFVVALLVALALRPGAAADRPAR